MGRAVLSDSAGRKRRPLHTVINYWGAAILMAGLSSAVLIYIFAQEDPDAEAARDIVRGRMYEHDLEVIGGKFTVYLAHLNDWFASLWQGTTLAYTVAVLAVAIALACFWVAHLIATTPPDDSRQERRR